MIDLYAAVVGVLAGGVGATVVWKMLENRRVPLALSVDAAVTDPYEDGRSQRMLAAFPFAAFLIDGDGIVRFVNAAAEELFDVRSERSVGRAVIAVVPSVAMERQVWAAIAGTTSMREIAIGNFAREQTLGVTAYPFEGGAVVVAADRTELLALDYVRREFIANVSHELRTPLAAIKLMLETILLDENDAEARALFLPQVAREVERMIRLVEELLDVARSESGQLLLRREVFDLTDVAKSVVTTFAQRALASGVELRIDSPDEVFVDADSNRLTQVAVNLVDNALRHTTAGDAVVVEIAGEGQNAVLRVRDTGQGIPYQDLPHIFDRFYVVDRSRAREHGGTGLGLSIARKIVDAHGGALSVQSVYGHGATFVCRLPLVEKASADDGS